LVWLELGLEPVMQSLRPVLVLRPVLRPFFEVLLLVLVKAVLVLVLSLDGLKNLKNCCLKTKKILKILRPFLDLKDLKIIILDEAKFQFLRS